MTINIFDTKNGTKTCSVNGILLHSSYNPQTEANRFVENIACDFVPENIFITEPGLSYCCGALKKRFPGCKICAVRYTHFFKNYDFMFDKVYYFSEENEKRFFERNIFRDFSESDLCKSLFLSWFPSAKAFSEQEKEVLTVLKQIVKKSKTILFTKSFFSKRWIKNSITFCVNARNIQSLSGFDSPVIITASGPSLLTSIPPLKKFRSSYFLICVSSALSVLCRYDITPDLVISTDAGYWAKTHLRPLLKRKDIPVAISAESACNKELLHDGKIIPLNYSDGIESSIMNIWLKNCGTIYLKAERNGTVSGTAIKLALSLTDKKIFCCGLDLAPSSSFQHTQPNMLEISASAADFKLLQSETRQVKAGFCGESLKIYEDWFSDESANIGKRFFRLSDNYKYSNKLGVIQDVNFDYFESEMKNSPPVDTRRLFSNIKIITDDEIKKIKDELYKFLCIQSQTDVWLKNIFPADYLLFEKKSDGAEKNKKHEELLQKNKNFLKELTRLIYGKSV